MKKKTSALIPGTFDPVTVGHFEIIRTASAFFDEVTVLLGNNADKNTMFSLEERKTMLTEAVGRLGNVTVAAYDGLIGDYCLENKIDVIYKGLRSSSDYDYEEEMALVNGFLSPETKTLFLEATGDNRFVSSTMVRTFLKAGRDVSQWLPEGVKLPEKPEKSEKIDKKGRKA